MSLRRHPPDDAVLPLLCDVHGDEFRRLPALRDRSKRAHFGHWLRHHTDVSRRIRSRLQRRLSHAVSRRGSGQMVTGTTGRSHKVI